MMSAGRVLVVDEFKTQYLEKKKLCGGETAKKSLEDVQEREDESEV